MTRRPSVCVLVGLSAAVSVIADDRPVKIPVAGAIPIAGAPQPARMLRLADVERLAVMHNPKLRQAAFAVDAARGKALQAALYPNPKLSVAGDELGDDQGAGGIWAAPVVEQEIVTGGKRRLSHAAARQEADRLAVEIAVSRYALLGEVREAYYDLAQLQLRRRILADSIEIAQPSVERLGKLLRAKQVAPLDLATLKLELENLQADIRSVELEIAPAQRRLEALVGMECLPAGVAELDLSATLPPYELERLTAVVLGNHPEARSAEIAVAAARLALDRARAEPIPNVTLQAGYVRQNQNRSHDWLFGFSLPLPTFDRNQGNLRAAQATLGHAEQEVLKVRNDLRERIAKAFRVFAAGRATAQHLDAHVLPLAEETFELSRNLFERQDALEYLRVLEAQRGMTQAKLKRAAALGEAWKAAAGLSALALEEDWPPVVPKP